MYQKVTSEAYTTTVFTTLMEETDDIHALLGRSDPNVDQAPLL